MIGILATSGSVAIRFRNVVIACSLSSRSASMLTSSRFGPPAPWSGATAAAAGKPPPPTSLRNRAEPVTFVRSPIITKPVSGPISNGSRPLKRGRLGGPGVGRALRAPPPPRRLGDRSRLEPPHGRRDLRGVLGRGAAAAADDVDEAFGRELAEERA